MNGHARARRRLGHRIVISAAATAAALPLLTAAVARAQSIWINPAGGNWSNPANWSGGAPTVSGSNVEVLQFNVSAASSYAASNDLAFNHQLNTLSFDNNGAATAFVTGQPLMLTSGGLGAQIVQDGSGPAVIAQDVNFGTNVTLAGSGAGDLTLAGGFGKSSSFSVTKSNPNRTNLNGANTNWSGTLTLNAGILALGSTSAMTIGSIGLSGGAIIENSAAFTSLSRNVGTGFGQLKWTGDGGFAARGADFSVSLGNRIWGSSGFVPVGSALVFGDPLADHTVVYTNSINLVGGPRTINVIKGIGTAPEARLSDPITNGTLLKTGNGMLQISAPVTSVSLNVSAGTLLLTANNSQPQPTVLTGGVLRIGGAGSLSNNSNVNLSGGAVLEGSALFPSLTRNTGTGPGAIRWTGDGGFSATGADLNVDLNSTLPLAWSTGNFVPTGSALVFGSAASDHTVQFQNGLDLGGAARTINVNKGIGTDPEANLAGPIFSGSLVKTGPGTLLISNNIVPLSGLTNTDGTTILTGSNFYSGPTTVSGGALRIGGASALSASTNVNLAGGVLEGSSQFNSLSEPIGTGPGQIKWTADGGFSATVIDMTVALNGGATLLWGNGSFVPAGNALLFGSPNANRTVIFQNGLDNGGGAPKTINVTRGVGTLPEAKFTGNIGGNGTFIKTGNGTLEISSNINSLAGFNNAAGMTILSGNNNYSGATTISGGVIRVMPTDFGTSLSSGSNLNFAGGVLELSGFGSTFSRTIGTAAGNMQWTGDGGFAALQTDVSLNWSSPTFPATWGSGNFVPSGSALVFGSETSDRTITVVPPINLGAAARTIRVNKGVGTVPEVKFNGIFTSGSLIKTGAGTMQIASALGGSITGITNTAGMTILSGSNTYTGNTTVSGGILRMAASGAIPTSSHVVLSGGGIIEGTSAATNFSRLPGTSGGTVEWQGDGGFAATGADMTVYWSAGSWGLNGFVPPGSALLFGSPDADHTVNVIAGFDVNNGDRTIRVAQGIGSTPEVKFTAPISGTGGLIKEGPGTLQFTTGNSYSGNTFLNGGTLIAAGPFTLGSGAPTNNIAFNGGTLRLATGGPPWVTGRTVTLSAGGGTIDTNGLNGSFTGAITGSGSLSKSGPGNLTIRSANIGPLSINTDGAAGRLITQPRSTTGFNTPLRTTSLSIGPKAALDLNDNDLVVLYGATASPFTTIRNLVLTGFRGAVDPAATGIVSTTGQNTGGDAILALFDNALVNAPTWAGQTILSTTVVGKYTYFGDLNFDGQVTGDDYTVIDSNLNTTPPVGLEWLSGDGNFDGLVTGDDYTVIDSNLNLGVGNPLAPSRLAPSSLQAVPEPTLMSTLIIGLTLLRRRRRA